jgi:4'-phosphopantetheinyl transferase
MEIYAFNLKDVSSELMNKLLLLIDYHHRSKIERFKNEQDKLRSLIGNVLVRSIIIKRIGIENSSIKFIKNKNGKPYLHGFPNFQFNISHSGEYVVCAIDDKPIGIDIEEIKPLNYIYIAKKIFTEKEIKYLLNCDEKDELSRFYEVFTLKESFVKCIGEGLHSINSVNFSIDTYKNVKGFNKFNNNSYHFRIMPLCPTYMLSICSMSFNFPLSIKLIRAKDFINIFQ